MLGERDVGKDSRINQLDFLNCAIGGLMDILKVIQGFRTTPGVILFDPKGKLRYVKEQALEMIPSLNKKGRPGNQPDDNLPPELFNLVNQMVNSSPKTDPFSEPVFNSAMMTSSWGISLSLQGISLVSKGGEAASPPDLGGTDR
jgi:hypothetical protein